MICSDGEKQRLLSEIKDRLHDACAMDDVAEILPEFLSLLEAERFTLWVCGPAKSNAFFVVIDSAGFYADEGIPVSGDDVICVSALSKRVINLTDVYDAAELTAVDKRMVFNPAYDRKAGFRTKQLLTVPLIKDDRYLYGVMQFANCGGKGVFGREDEDLVVELCVPMAAVLDRLSSQSVTERSMAELLERYGIGYDQGIEMAIVGLIRDYRDMKGRLEKIQGVLEL